MTRPKMKRRIMNGFPRNAFFLDKPQFKKPRETYKTMAELRKEREFMRTQELYMEIQSAKQNVDFTKWVRLHFVQRDLASVTSLMENWLLERRVQEEGMAQQFPWMSSNDYVEWLWEEWERYKARREVKEDKKENLPPLVDPKLLETPDTQDWPMGVLCSDTEEDEPEDEKKGEKKTCKKKQKPKK